MFKLNKTCPTANKLYAV
nr:NADH-plastoquinone oxidoreductase subunit 3 [Smilax moranensis]